MFRTRSSTSPRLQWFLLFALLLVLVAVMSTSAARTAVTAQVDEIYQISLKSRQFTPDAGYDINPIIAQTRQPLPKPPDLGYTLYMPFIAGGTNLGPDVHFLIQFRTLPDAKEKEDLAAQGIHLVSYVTGNAYIGTAKSAYLESLKAIPNVRWIGPIEVEDKIEPELLAGDIGIWARVDASQIGLTIQFHQGTNINAAIAQMRQLGGRLISVVPAVPSITAIFDQDSVREIAGLDSVQYISQVAPAMGEHNDQTRTATNVNLLRQAPYNLSGAGITVLVYDSGMIDSAGHVDFAGRVIELDGDASETVRDHSTHVAGTVGGDGSNSNGNDSAGNPNGGTANQWAGMAPGVNFRSFGSSGSTDVLYDDGGDLNGDFTTAVTNGIDLATMSLGNNVVLNGFPCGQLGDYTNVAILLDNIVRGSIGGQQLIYFQSAGNERQSGAPCGQFSTISSPATSKNTVVVGAINSNDNSMTGFSSFGPTDDGRLKPDITAPGCQTTGDGGLTSPSFIDTDNDGNFDAGETQNAYVVKCGTSMATPATAGAAALMLEQWQTLNGAGTRPLPHTVKAIVDLGNPGPDYQFGWGALDAQAAVDLVIANDTDALIHVDQVDNGGTDFYTFNSDGSANMQVTIAWSDPAATRLAATTLINDLDLRLTDPDGIVYQPFVLNPASPGNNATNGNDNINNVEMVVGTAKAGTWTVSIAGTAVPSGPQQYTLITPEDGVPNNRPPVADADGPYTTDEGVDAILDATGSSDPDADTLTYEWDLDDDGAFDDATGTAPNFDMVGQDGVFDIHLRVTDEHGAFDTDSSTVTVLNVPPSVLGLASDAPVDENNTVTVSGVIADPGWLELLTGTIDWGDGTAVEPIVGILENVRPNATLTFSHTHVYGDNGTFTVEVCGFDDDTSTCDDIDVQTDNVAPTADIDETGTILINGNPVFLGQINVPMDFSGRSTDPGSDDLFLSWSWDDGPPAPDVTTPYLVNPPGNDPLPSPTIQPRDVTDTQTHTFTDACLYDIEFSAMDDDGGASPVDDVLVIIVGEADRTRMAGYWQHQYGRQGHTEFDDATLECYLEIIGLVSNVFNEDRDASTILAAFDVMWMAMNGGSASEKLDRWLLTSWLNFANGALAYDQMFDIDHDGVDDGTFADIVAAAEAVRLNPASTDAELHAQRQILVQLNNPGG